MKKKQCCDGNPFVGIAGTVGGMLVGILVLTLVFTREQVVPVMASVSWALVTLGIFMGYFAYKKK